MREPLQFPTPDSVDFAEAEHERLVAALKASRAGTWRWNVATNIVEWDDALCDVYGIERRDAPTNSEEFLALVHPDDRAAVWATISACIEKGTDADYQFRAVVGNSVCWIYDRSALIRDAEGNPAYMLGACLDVTDRRRIEEERDKLLEKQTLLLRELSHRTKNHLSMIISLLRLKGARQKDPGAKQDFERAIERVHTIAFLHEHLYRKDVFDRINIESYLEDICASLELSLLAERKIAIVRELQAAELHIDLAVPLGLIVNEVVTNAAKYAFLPGEAGRIVIRFRRRGDQGILTISDNGRGLAEPVKSQGIGTTLIRSLAKQIGARVRVVTRNGLTYSFVFRTLE
ncbi:sensor histidine kinase [Bradyrhizobium sp.]|uniref:sensor histidine kinase n=1 Tax=Bradyrhizobium sp. TaxID=376 RepID=UPI002735E353|nr:histidine kinase dimerization/phosphoacceptor domain -containing protein [Bradyrhizobium sp.]MDP3692814.1 histidine kinase dimerization/phosphoacceptor domain -containing protein [Bradyrhizobium sp.]